MSLSQSVQRPSQPGFAVGSQLAALVAIGVSIGFLIVMALQIAHSRSLHREHELLRNSYSTQLAATQIYGDLRWRRVESLANVTANFAARYGDDVAAIAVIERSGSELSRFERAVDDPIDLLAVAQDAITQTAANKVYTSARDNRFIVAAPVISNEEHDRAGTFIVAWNLDGLNEAVRANVINQGMVALATIAFFVIASLVFVNRRLGRPLADITAATNRIANGDKSFEIPWTGRKDEIGDMARSLVTFKENVALIDRLTAEQQQQTMRLSKALEKEREYNALHRDFVSMVSHEFRTPVAIIDGAAQRIIRKAGKDTSEQLQERAAKIRGAVSRIIELIDSTLSLSRLEAGSIELEIEDVDIGALLREVCQRQQEIAEQHDISLIIANLPPLMRVDAKRIDQVFTNLLSNAVKYAANRPQIDVKAGTVGGKVVVSVRDRGIGIPKQEQPKLFEKFFRASTSTGIPGTGIGLHLVKHLVELHGGQVTIDSIEGAGTTVSVTLPIGREHRPTCTGADELSLAE